MSDDQEARQALEELEAAIRKAATAAGFEGLITDWTVVVAVQDFDDHGDGWTIVAQLLPVDGRIPHYRVIGLLDSALTHMRNDIGGHGREE